MKVFVFTYSLLGSPRKVWGTLKQCKKHRWIDFEDGTRVRADRVPFWTEDEYAKHKEQLEKIAQEESQRKAQIDADVAAKKHQESVNVDGDTLTMTKVAGDGTIFRFCYQVTAKDAKGYWGILKSMQSNGVDQPLGYQPESFVLSA